MSSRLDMLLKEGQEPKKVSKTVNLSEDVVEALNTLRPGVRSKFIDLALRETLEDKGLLPKKEA